MSNSDQFLSSEDPYSFIEDPIIEAPQFSSENDKSFFTLIDSFFSLFGIKPTRRELQGTNRFYKKTVQNLDGTVSEFDSFQNDFYADNYAL